MDLIVAVYDAAKRFPPEERFALTDQLRRAVVSVPSNIAEGNGRDSDRSALQFCLIAHGSLREVETQITIAHRLGYIDDGRFLRLRACCDDTGGPLRGLIAHLRGRSEGKGIREDNPTPYDVET